MSNVNSTETQSTPQPDPIEGVAEVDLGHNAPLSGDHQLPELLSVQSNFDGPEDLRLRRHLFDNRRDFNFMVCDELVARKIIPTVLNVLSCGAWGSAGDVSKDLKAWKAEIVARQGERSRGPLPIEAQRTADRMLSQLMELCEANVRAPYEIKINALHELSVQKDQLIQSARNEFDLASTRQAEIAAAQAQQIESLRLELEQIQHDLSNALITISNQNEALIAKTSEIEQMRLHHDRLMQAQSDQHAAQIDLLRQDAQQRLELLKQQYDRSLSALQSELDRARVEAQGSIRAAQAQIEQAREDASRWSDSASRSVKALEESRSRELALRDAMAQSTIAMARQDLLLSNAQQRQQSLESSLAVVTSELEQLKASSVSSPAPSPAKRIRRPL